jgi:hypothetical protein
MRKRIQEFKFEIRARAENVVVVGVEDTAQFRRLIDIIAGAAFCHEQGLNTRSVRMWRLGCPAVGRTEAIVIAVSGSPFRGTLCFWPRILRGDGPRVFRADSDDKISRQDRELVAALCRSVGASEGWL